MRRFNTIFTVILVVIAAIFAAANIAVVSYEKDSGREYRVEISRLARTMAETEDYAPDLSGCKYVVDVYELDADDVDIENDYMLQDVNGTLYVFEYKVEGTSGTWIFLIVNISIGVLALIVIIVMLYIKKNVLKPFARFSEVPIALSKGELTAPLEDNKNRYFGKFVWGVNMLRENIEDRNQREMELQKEKKVLLLSLSHDMKTPLSTIKLYAQALSKNLYKDEKKKNEIAESINSKADEMEGYLAQIITASREDFLNLEVNVAEFYLGDMVNVIDVYYHEKLSLVGTEFIVEKYQNCIIKGDLSRSVEVLQNIIENAIKYGDGRHIGISFSEDEGCILVKVSNSGEAFSNDDVPHMFESFWRGGNSTNKKGSGLGLYICRQLMTKMNGDIFAEYKDGCMNVTAVFAKAR